MRKLKMQKQKYKTKKTNNGITLIPLVITIVIMLILGAVTVSMTVNGGLFEYSGKAVDETQNAIDYEQKLAKGRIKKGGKWYASMNDYLKNKPMGITIENKLNIGISANYDVTTSTPATERIIANLSGIDGTVTYESDNEDVAVVDDTGLITAIKKGTSKIKAKVRYDGEIFEDECSVNVVECSEVWIGPGNRNQIGYTSETSNLVIPKIFYNESNGRWYKSIAIDMSAFADQTNLTKVTVPNGVTTVATYAFLNCTNLKKVNLPESLTTLGGCVFWGCTNLTSVGPIGSGASVEIPSGIAEIPGAVFRDCDGLTSVSIPEGVVTVADAFRSCDALETVTLPASLRSTDNTFNWCSALKEVVIPNGLETLGTSTFSRCYELGSITIPASVTSIGIEAFFNCKSLKEINYTGTTAQWEAITKGSSWNLLVPASEVICSDGKVSLK